MEPSGSDERGWMEREVDRELHQIKDAMSEDPDTPFSAEQVNFGVSELFKFAQERAFFVADEVDHVREEDPYWAVP
jgi:hypothetical protein